MKNTHAGGERTGAGPPNKPPGEHKKQIYISLERDFIKEWGGEKKLQEDIKKFIHRELQKGKCKS